MLATYLESHAADLGKSLLPLSLRKGLCCLYLLSASTPCLFHSLHTPRQSLKLLIFGRTVGLALKAEQCNNQAQSPGPTQGASTLYTTLPSLYPFPHPSAPTPTWDLCIQHSLQPPTIAGEEMPSQIATQPTSNLNICLAQVSMRATLESSVCSRTRSN